MAKYRERVMFKKYSVGILIFLFFITLLMSSCIVNQEIGEEIDFDCPACPICPVQKITKCPTCPTCQTCPKQVECPSTKASGIELLSKQERPPRCPDDKKIEQSCTWVECYEPSTKPKLAIVITGQITRLEIRSKIQNVFNANADDYDITLVFLLKQDKPVSTTVKKRADSPYSTTEWCDTDALKMWIKDKLFVNETLGEIVMRQEAMNRQQMGDVITRKGFYTTVRNDDGSLKYRVALTVSRGEINGEILENKGWKHRMPRERNFFAIAQESFRTMRRNMMILEDIEYKTKTFSDIVFRLREDTLVHLPYKLKGLDIGPNTIVTPNCWGSGGINDVNYIVGRGIASKVIRGMAEDYYFRITKHYGNPETHLEEIIASLGAKTITQDFCEWPMVPVVWKKNDKGYYLEGRKITTLLTGNCLKSKLKKQKFCAWRKSDIEGMIVDTKNLKSPYLQKWAN